MNLINRSHEEHTRYIICIIILFLCVTESKLFANPIRTVEATVSKVSDGDTIQVITPEGTKLKVRLYGIDATEIEHVNDNTGRISKPGQKFAHESQRHLSSLIMRKKVRLDILDIDRYRRMVAIIWLGDRNINLEMIQKGMAEAYREYLREPYRNQFIRAEQDAKTKKIGIWSQPEYERPSEFRKRMREGGE